MDAAGFMPPDAPAAWSVYFAVADTDASIAAAEQRGGKTIQPAEDTPYGRLVTLVDPYGAQFKLIGPNAAPVG